MRLRHLIVALFICAIPTLANAWTINATSGANGTISPSGAVSVAGTTGTSQQFTVAPNTGYRILALYVDNVLQTLPTPGSSKTYTMTYNGASTRSTRVSFTTYNLKLTPTLTYGPGSNGWVTTKNLAGTILNINAIPVNTQVVSTVTAAAGSQIASVTFNGGTPTIMPDGTTSFPVSYTMDTNKTIAATFAVAPAVSANAGEDKTTAGNGPLWPVTLNGTSTVNNGATPTYSWTAAPAGGVLTGANTATPSFSSLTPGTYTLQLTVTAGGVSATDTATVTVPWRSVYLSDYCITCHINRDQTVATQYMASAHRTTGPDNVAACESCHNRYPGDNTHYTSTVSLDICRTCHVNVDAQSGTTVVADFDASAHGTNSVACSRCHVPHQFKATFTVCYQCHVTGGEAPPPPTASFHPAVVPEPNNCNGCHSSHNTANVAPPPHFAPADLTGAYRAQYVTANISCEQCHTSYNTADANMAHRKEWILSGKGDANRSSWSAQDYKTKGTAGATPATSSAQDCVRCHTTTGFIKYVADLNADGWSDFTDIAPWGAPTDKAKEVLACNACHDNTSTTFTRRSVGLEINPSFNPGLRAVQAWYSYSSAATKKIIRTKSYQNPAGGDFVDSNICIACHTGTSAGDLIKLSTNCVSAPSIACRVGVTGPFWGAVDFIDPHNMNESNIMLPDGLRAGYEYRLGTSSTPFHTNINGSQGPCVGCHMTSSKIHTFAAVSSASNGTITAITSNKCVSCHGTLTANPIDPAILQTAKEGYQAAMTVIAAQLAGKGIYYDALKAPYFFTTSDSNLQSIATRTVNWNLDATFQGAHMMGAAFNLKLMKNGSSWVHNPTYGKRVLYDTIDYLDDGNASNNTVVVTIQNLATVDPATKAKAIAYLSPRP